MNPSLSENQRQLVRRIAESPHFRKSPRLREFLFFITDRLLEGQADQLTEQNIGCHVFERPVGYSPAEDNIVRVSVRQLRSKLRDYFESDGRDEGFILDVPKGGYIPVFKPVEPAAVQPGKVWQIWALAAASAIAVISCALAIGFWRENRALQAAGAATATAPTLVSELLLKSNQPVTVVLSDSGLVLMQDLMDGRLIELEDYAKRNYFAGAPPSRESSLANLWQALATRQFTSVDNVTLVSRVLKAHPANRDQILIRHARSIDIRDFKTGNFIIQGGVLSTPWAALFEQHLNFRLERTGSGGFVHNLRPQPGEPAEYAPPAAGSKTSYARIAVVPNLSGTGKILLVAGFGTAASEAAAEFALSPSSLALVQHTLGLSDLSRMDYFELMLETSVFDGSGSGAQIVAFRR